MYLVFYCLCLCALPLVVWAQMGAPTVVWIPAGLVSAATVCAWWWGVRLLSRSREAASRFVSGKVGHTVQLAGQSFRPDVWRTQIAFATDPATGQQAYRRPTGRRILATLAVIIILGTVIGLGLITVLLR